MVGSRPGRVKMPDADVASALRVNVPAWRRTDEGVIEREFRTAGWKATMMAVNAIAHLAEMAWHHPELAVSFDCVVVRLSTHEAGGITMRDIELAQEIEKLLTWRPAPGAALEGTPEDDPRFAYLKRD